MPIPFGCECGKRLQAKDEFAGKKMRCPGCGKILVIPAAPSAPPASPPAESVSSRAQRLTDPPEGNGHPPEPAPVPAPVVAVVHFVCSCGRRLKARKSDAGADIDCPDCGRTLTIPPENSDDPPPPEVQRNPYEDGFLSQTVTPWKDGETRRRGADTWAPHEEKVGSWLPMFVVVLLIGGVAAWWYFVPQIVARAHALSPKVAAAPARVAKPFHELSRVPADAAALLAVRPGATGAAEGLLARQLGKPGLAGLPNRIGTVERLTLVVMQPDPYSDLTAGKKGSEKDTWLFVRTKDPYDPEAVLKALWPKADHHRKSYYARPYYVMAPFAGPPMGMPMGGPNGKFKGPGKGQFKGPPMGGQPMMPPKGPSAPGRSPAVYFAGPTVFVICDTVSVKRLLRWKDQAVQEPFDQAIKEVAEGKGLVIGLNQKTVLLTAPALPLDPNVPPLLPALKSFTTALVSVDAAETDAAGGFTYKVHLSFKEAADANTAHRALETWRVEQERQRAERRQEIATARTARRTHASLVAAVQMMGGVTGGQPWLLGPVRIATAPPQPPTPPEEDAELARLKAAEAFQKGLVVSPVNDKAVEFSLRAGPQFAVWAQQFLAPYTELAANSIPQPRVVRAPPFKMPKGMGK